MPNDTAFTVMHQMQPTPITCMCTSLAMVTGKPAGEIIRQLHDDYYAIRIVLSDMLDRLGVPHDWFKSTAGVGLDEDGVYLLSVPSLNIVGGLHSIVVEVVDDDWRVYDPCMGREGAKYYTHYLPAADNEVLLKAYTVDARIPLSYVREAYHA